MTFVPKLPALLLDSDGFCPELKDWLDTIPDAKPHRGSLRAANSLIRDLKTSGAWEQFLLCQLLANTEGNSLVDLADPTVHYTVHGAPTFQRYKGWTGNQNATNTHYIDTGKKFTTHDSGLGSYVSTSDLSQGECGATGGTGQTAIDVCTNNSAGKFWCGTHSSSVFANRSPIGLVIVSRQDDTKVNVAVNGAVVVLPSAFGALPSGNIILLQAGLSATGTTNRVSAFFALKGALSRSQLQSVNAAFVRYLLALKAYFEPPPPLAVMGQAFVGPSTVTVSMDSPAGGPIAVATTLDVGRFEPLSGTGIPADNVVQSFDADANTITPAVPTTATVTAGTVLTLGGSLAAVQLPAGAKILRLGFPPNPPGNGNFNDRSYINYPITHTFLQASNAPPFLPIPAFPDGTKFALFQWVDGALNIPNGGISPVFRKKYNSTKGPISTTDGSEFPGARCGPVFTTYEKSIIATMVDLARSCGYRPFGDAALATAIGGILVDYGLIDVAPSTLGWVELAALQFDVSAWSSLVYASVTASGANTGPTIPTAATPAGIAAGRAVLGPDGKLIGLVASWVVNTSITLQPTVTHTTTADTPSGATLPLDSTVGIAAGMPAVGTNVPGGDTVDTVAADGVTLVNPISGDVPSGTSIGFGPPLAVTNGTTLTICDARFVLDSFTLTQNSTGDNSGATIPVANTAGVANGDLAIGVGLPAGATITSFVPNTSIHLSSAPGSTVGAGTLITICRPGTDDIANYSFYKSNADTVFTEPSPNNDGSLVCYDRVILGQFRLFDVPSGEGMVADFESDDDPGGSWARCRTKLMGAICHGQGYWVVLTTDPFQAAGIHLGITRNIARAMLVEDVDGINILSSPTPPNSDQIALFKSEVAYFTGPDGTQAPPTDKMYAQIQIGPNNKNLLPAYSAAINAYLRAPTLDGFSGLPPFAGIIESPDFAVLGGDYSDPWNQTIEASLGMPLD